MNSHVRRAAFVCLVVSVGALAQAGCETVAEPTPAQRWERALALWQARDPSAYAAWLAVDPTSAEGARARDGLRRADAEYTRALAAFAARDRAGARERFARAAALAPIDPARYLPLARIYREQAMAGPAARYYRKYLAAAVGESAAARAAAERELRELDDPGPAEALDRAPVVAAAEPSRSPAGGWLAVALLVLGFAVLGAVLASSGSRGLRTLDRVIARHPELHPALGYLLGSLRHELFKHRVAALGAALDTGFPAARSGAARWHADDLLTVWGQHMDAFGREVGHRIDVRRDPHFARARRDLTTLARGRVAAPGDPVPPRMRRALERLRTFDRWLASRQTQLVRTRVDEPLLRAIATETLAEILVGWNGERGALPIDDFECRSDALPVEVEVLGSDLKLILRNVLRNAVATAARSSAPRCVALDVEVSLEPTGEELVTFAVRDSSDEALTTQDVARAGLGHGLGLVYAATRRYGGSVEVIEQRGRFRKAVCVRFFRLLSHEPAAAGDSAAAGRIAARPEAEQGRADRL